MVFLMLMFVLLSYSMISKGHGALWIMILRISLKINAEKVQMEGFGLSWLIIFFVMAPPYLRNIDSMYLALVSINTHISTFPSFRMSLALQLGPPR
jgi:hypothetical protein